jgi:hypothetical protein
MRIIGLDPSLRTKGFAACEMVYDTNEAVETINFYRFARFYNFIDFCQARIHDESIYWAVENSNLQNATFAHYKGNTAQLKKISRNVGANQGISQAVVDMLVYYFTVDRVVEVSPAQKGIKWDTRTATHVAAQYGIKLPQTSQDERDAFKIATIGYTNYLLTKRKTK